MDIAEKLALISITIRDLVVNVSDDFQPMLDQKVKLGANIQMSLSDKLTMLHGEGHEQSSAVARDDGFPEFLLQGCKVQFQTVFDFSVYLSELEGEERDRPQVANYACLYDLTYDIRSRVDEMDDFKSYIERTAIFDSWPYFRDYARTVFTKMGFRVVPPIPVHPDLS